MLSCTQLLIAASALLFLTTALPQHTSLTPTTTPQTPNCEISSSEASYSSSCWNQLDTADYLIAWSQNTPTCVPKDPANFACCYASEPWSLCFLRISTGVGGYDCTKLGSPSCNYDVEIRQNTPSLVAPQMRYVLRNILAVNAMFTAYYGGQAEGAIQNAAPAAGTTMGEIADSLDFNGKTALNVVNVINALSVGLPFFGTPSLQNESLSSAHPLLQIGKIFAQSLQQTPTVTNAIWNATQDPTNQALSVRYMGQQLPTSNILNRIYNDLNAGLGLIMSNIPTFLNFSASGAWSTPNLIQPTALTNSTPGIDLALLTYVTSETLAQQNFSITPLATIGGLDFVPLFNASRDSHYNGSSDVSRAQGNETIYWSPNTQRQYQFVYDGGKLANGSTVDPYAVLKQIETNKWADLPVLFDGAYNCTLEGKAGGPVVNVGNNGSLDASCMSALPAYIGRGASCPIGAVEVGGKCPFQVGG